MMSKTLVRDLGVVNVKLVLLICTLREDTTTIKEEGKEKECVQLRCKIDDDAA